MILGKLGKKPITLLLLIHEPRSTVAHVYVRVLRVLQPLLHGTSCKKRGRQNESHCRCPVLYFVLVSKIPSSVWFVVFGISARDLSGALFLATRVATTTWYAARLCSRRVYHATCNFWTSHRRPSISPALLLVTLTSLSGASKILSHGNGPIPSMSTLAGALNLLPASEPESPNTTICGGSGARKGGGAGGVDPPSDGCVCLYTSYGVPEVYAAAVDDGRLLYEYFCSAVYSSSTASLGRLCPKIKGDISYRH